MTLLVWGIGMGRATGPRREQISTGRAACPTAMLLICWWGRHSCLPRAGAERRSRSSGGERRPVTALDVSRRPKCRAFVLRRPAAALQSGAPEACPFSTGRGDASASADEGVRESYPSVSHTSRASGGTSSSMGGKRDTSSAAKKLSALSSLAVETSPTTQYSPTAQNS